MRSENAFFDITGFLWCIFAVNMAYPVLACLQGRLFAYPAKRHHSDRISIGLITSHILAGGLVIWGGCAVFLALHFHCKIPKDVYQAIACAGFAHAASNITLFRKIPGLRAINVPFYVVITGYNWYRAVLLFQHHDTRNFYLLWCSVTTFVFVRFYLGVFFLLTFSTHDYDSTATYETVYTACLPYASIWGIVIPAVSLGADPRWLCVYGAPAVLGPMMLASYRASLWLECKLLGRQQGMFVRLLLLPVRFLQDSTNPTEYHDNKDQPEPDSAVKQPAV